MNTQNSNALTIATSFDRIDNGVGSHRVTSRVHKINKLVQAMSVTDSDDGLLIGSDLIPNTTIRAFALHELADKEGKELDNNVAALKLGFASWVQAQTDKNLKEGTSGTDKKQLASVRSVQTAEQYKESCLKLGLANLSLSELLPVFDFSDKSTKADLLAFAESIKSALFSADQSATYENMIAKEEQVAKQFESLTTEGFTDVQRVDDVTFSAIIPSANASGIVQRLDGLGYLFKTHTMSPDFSQLTVVFSVKQ